MARKSTDLKRIEARRDEIADRMSILETELEKLRYEDSELESAQKVLERLAAIEMAAAHVTVTPDADNPDNLGVMGESCGFYSRPDAPGTPPTIGDMALQVLMQSGPQGASSNDILEEIRKRWLPTLMRTSLSPPLSRLKAKSIIHLVGDRWKMGAGNEVDEYADI